ncbi:MAG: Smr/MutS family protein [Proteobacteria bacterium]|nr:Smr/MutS family protein [Pseudomonadota bacterium]
MKRKLSPDELQLWKSYVKDVKALPKVKKDQKELSLDVTAPLKSQTPLVPVVKSQKKPKLDKLETPLGAFVRKEVRHVKIDARLDMHGMTLEEGYRAVERFLLNAQERGLKLVLVITGKGALSSENTLRHQFPRWLQEDPLKRLIVAFHHPVKPEHGGQGAFYIRVKSKKK